MSQVETALLQEISEKLTEIIELLRHVAAAVGDAK